LRFQKTAKNSRASIRVAWIMPTLERGYYWQPLHREFTRLFPNTVIFTGNWPGYLRGYEESFTVQQLEGFKFVVLRRTEAGADIGFTRAPASILPALRRFRPSVIFTSSFTIWTLYALAYKFHRDCRVVAIWDGTSPGVAYLDSLWHLWLRRFLARFLDAVITNSQAGERYLQDILRIPESKIVRHPYQVPEPDALCSGKDGENPFKLKSRPVFLFVGSLITRKGWRYLLEAAAQLVQRGMDSFSVILAGDGEQRQDLLRMIAALGLESIVHVLGQVRYEDLGALFLASDVFVLPTLEDVWAVVVLEAMAFGKPVLCSQYAGAKEMVEHGANGYVFDPRSPRELAEYMARFIQRPELIAEFGQKSKEIMAPYTPACAAKVLESLVLRLLGSNARELALEELPQRESLSGPSSAQVLERSARAKP
jgi:glycosyltransferase involved in cell wall biosynthesis